MRGLLGTLRDHTEPGEHLPQPTAAGIAALCGQHRQAGRTVALSVHGDPRPLPAAVDLSVYRVAEVALAETDAGEVALSVGYEEGSVRLSVGASRGTAPTGTWLAAVRERIDAVGGTVGVRSGSDGWDLHARFPAPEPAVALVSGRP
jgi:signal transduction histidine kinase